MQFHPGQKTRRKGGFANIFTSGFGREHIHERSGTLRGEIEGAAAMKRLIRGGRKAKTHFACRCFIAQFIKQLAVIAYDILHVIAIFQSPLNLEGGDARLEHLIQERAAV